MESKAPVSAQTFNNADSFAQAFDEAWLSHNLAHSDASLEAGEKLNRVLALLAEHPFLLDDFELARQVADFRIRLLGL
jgi:hypothetical protein